MDRYMIRMMVLMCGVWVDVSKYAKISRMYTTDCTLFILWAKPILNGLVDVVNIDFKVDTSAAMKEITDRFIRLGTESD